MIVITANVSHYSVILYMFKTLLLS